MAYFDWNATAPVLLEAREAWLEASDRFWGNPSTAYRLGAQAKLEIEQARKTIADCLSVQPDRVVFTSGATESNNGFIRAALARSAPDGKIWISSVEHPSVLKAAIAIWGEDRVECIPVNDGGIIDLKWLETQLPVKRPALVSVMAVNNETGAVQPWQAVLELCESVGIPFHCDAVQWMGKLPWGDAPFHRCAGVSASGHKFGAPKGTGFLVLGNDWQGIGIQTGGSQERDSRAGTENVPGAVAMAVALKARLSKQLPTQSYDARDQFEEALMRHLPDARIHAKGFSRTWNTCSVGLPAFKSARWIARLDKLGFQVSTGSACSTGKTSSSPVLAAMGVDEDTAARTIRISSGWETKSTDWDELLKALLAVRKDLEEEEQSSGPGQVIEL